MSASSSSSGLVEQPVVSPQSCSVAAIAVLTFARPDADSRIVGLERHLAMTVGRQLMGSHKHSSSHRSRFRSWYEVSPVSCDSLSTPIEAQIWCRTHDHHRLMIVSSSCLQRHMGLVDCTCPTYRSQVTTSQSVALENQNRYMSGKNRRWRYVGRGCCDLEGRAGPQRLQHWSQTILVCVSFGL